MEKIIGKNLITAIPGIGRTYAKRLMAVGVEKVRISYFESIRELQKIFFSFASIADGFAQKIQRSEW